MKKMIGDRRVILILGGLSLLILAVLAAGLDHLDFHEAIPYHINWLQHRERITESTHSYSFILQIIIIMLLVALAGLIYALINRRVRKIFFNRVMQYLIVCLFALAIVTFFMEEEQDQAAAEKDAIPFSPSIVLPSINFPSSSAAPISESPQLPNWAPFAASLIFIGIMVVVAWVAWTHRKGKPLDGLAEIALAAASDIEAGMNIQDAIMRCYVQMTDVVKRRRGINRKDAMTPSEFACWLENAGLPGTPLRTLTHLFEKVRYGSCQSSEEDAFEAADCLRAIAAACGEGGT